jgi:hypothetical protein
LSGPKVVLQTILDGPAFRREPVEIKGLKILRTYRPEKFLLLCLCQELRSIQKAFQFGFKREELPLSHRDIGLQ